MDIYHHRWLRPCNLDIQSFLTLIQDSHLVLAHLIGNTRQTAVSPIMGVQQEPVLLIDDTAICFRLGGEERVLLRRCDTTQASLDLLSSVWNECSTEAPTSASVFALLLCILLMCLRSHVPGSIVKSTADPEIWKEAVTNYRACFPDRSVPPGPWIAETGTPRDQSVRDTTGEME